MTATELERDERAMASGMAAGSAKGETDGGGTSGEQRRVMIIQAHPDDAEFLCSGTVARLVAEGFRVQYVLATSGDKGSPDPGMSPDELAETREREQLEAAHVLGVAEVTFLRHGDGEIEVSLPFRRELAGIIRAGRPDVVFTFDPWQRYQIHPDHRAVGTTALDAVAAARDPMYFPEQIREGLSAQRVHNVYLFSTDEPNYYVDITQFMEKKLAALRAHGSQFRNPQVAEMIKARARTVGATVGVEFAEAFHYLPMMRPPELRKLPEW